MDSTNKDKHLLWVNSFISSFIPLLNGYTVASGFQPNNMAYSKTLKYQLNNVKFFCAVKKIIFINAVKFS